MSVVALFDAFVRPLSAHILVVVRPQRSDQKNEKHNTQHTRSNTRRILITSAHQDQGNTVYLIKRKEKEREGFQIKHKQSRSKSRSTQERKEGDVDQPRRLVKRSIASWREFPSDSHLALLSSSVMIRALKASLIMKPSFMIQHPCSAKHK